MRVVHIGFPKTATKLLQTRVFPALPNDYAYVARDAAERIFRPVTSNDDTIFDADNLAARLEQACSGRRHALFSYEPLTGLEYRSGFVNRTLIATRLRRLGFERVIITIRNQFDVLESAYKEYVRNGGVLQPRQYLSFDVTEPRYLYPEYYDYHSIFRLYAGIFGRSNVLVLQYERLREPSFLADLVAFLQVGALHLDAREPVNRSLSYRKTRLLRVINHFTCNAYHPSHLISNRISTSLFARALSALPFWNGGGSFLDPDLRAAIAAFYREPNAELAKDARLVLSPSYP